MNILVIDDDITKTDLFEILIECYPYGVTRINSQDEWKIKIEQTNPDLIILDKSSPDVDNYEMCKKIRKLISVPILFVSVIDNPELIAKALDAGADDVLTKPISKSLLTARLNGLMARCLNSKRFFGHCVSPSSY